MVTHDWRTVMAHSQAQARERSSGETQRTRNVPALQARGGQLGSREPAVWFASPFGLMRRLSEDMDQLFGQLLGGSGTVGALLSGPEIQWIPALEVEERDGKLLVQADLPGMGADDVTMEVDEGVLTISGERREERQVGGDGRRRTERRYGRFSRSIVLPEGARTDEIHAAFRNGVLEITIPLSQSTAHGRRIAIEGSSKEGNGGERESQSRSAQGSQTQAQGSQSQSAQSESGNGDRTG
jgi:HSP20 family protein